MKEPLGEISVQELEAQSYHEDRDAKRRFEQPYRWITIPALLLLVGAYPLARYAILPRFPRWDVGLIVFVIAAPVFLALGGSHLHVLRKIPRSRANSQPLVRYRRTDFDPNKVSSEYVYVDRTLKTYFTRVVAWRSDH